MSPWLIFRSLNSFNWVSLKGGQPVPHQNIYHAMNDGSTKKISNGSAGGNNNLFDGVDVYIERDSCVKMNYQCRKKAYVEKLPSAGFCCRVLH